MEQEFELIAKTFMGLEPVLAEELTQLGANNVQIGRRMVSFTGDKEMKPKTRKYKKEQQSLLDIEFNNGTGI